MNVGESVRLPFVISDGDVRQFVLLSGDDNRIHSDETAAVASPIGCRAVPGLLAAMVFSRVLGTMLPGHDTVYRSQNIQFRLPICANEPYVARIQVKKLMPRVAGAVMQTQVLDSRERVCIDGTALVVNTRRIYSDPT